MKWWGEGRVGRVGKGGRWKRRDDEGKVWGGVRGSEVCGRDVGAAADNRSYM